MKRNFYVHKVRVRDDDNFSHRSVITLEGYTIGRDHQINWKNPVTVNLLVYDETIRRINRKFIEHQKSKILDLKLRIAAIRDSVHQEE